MQGNTACFGDLQSSLSNAQSTMLALMSQRSFQPFICALVLLTWLLLFAGQFVTIISFSFDSPWYAGNAAEFSLWSGLSELFQRNINGLGTFVLIWCCLWPHVKLAILAVICLHRGGHNGGQGDRILLLYRRTGIRTMGWLRELGRFSFFELFVIALCSSLGNVAMGPILSAHITPGIGADYLYCSVALAQVSLGAALYFAELGPVAAAQPVIPIQAFAAPSNPTTASCGKASINAEESSFGPRNGYGTGRARASSGAPEGGRVETKPVCFIAGATALTLLTTVRCILLFVPAFTVDAGAFGFDEFESLSFAGCFHSLSVQAPVLATALGALVLLAPFLDALALGHYWYLAHARSISLARLQRARLRLSETRIWASLDTMLVALLVLYWQGSTLANHINSMPAGRFRIVLLPAAIYLCVDQMLVLPALIRPWLLHICDASVRANTGSGEHMPLLR